MSLSFLASSSKPPSPPLFLGQLLDLLLQGGECRFLEFLDGRLLLGEVAGDDQRGGNQLGLAYFFLADREVGLLFGLLALVFDDNGAWLASRQPSAAMR